MLMYLTRHSCVIISPLPPFFPFQFLSWNFVKFVCMYSIPISALFPPISFPAPQLLMSFRKRKKAISTTVSMKQIYFAFS